MSDTAGKKNDSQKSENETTTGSDASAEKFAEKKFSFLKQLYKKLPVKSETFQRQRDLVARFAPRLLSVKDFTLPPIPRPQVFFDDPTDHFGNAKKIKLETLNGPLVSIIIAVYGKIEYTLNCLASIAANPPQVLFEILIVDDYSPDNSFEVLKNVSGVRLLQNEENQGFIRSCNRAADMARGEYLCFLNNDTQVTSGWLDELVRTFRDFPETGLAGSKLIYPDGKLQEAGSLVWQNGMASNYGWRKNPLLPVYNYAREVDYCSGASILVPKKLFDELGKFDEFYMPAYCEDTDLALNIRKAGHRVIYQPLSQVIHYEGITSGKSTNEGAKAYQVENLKKLYSRWKYRLRSHQPFGVDIDNAKDRRANKRVLLMEHCTPAPDKDAGSVTIFNLMLLLREMDFQVTFIPEDNFLYLPEYTEALQRVGIEVLYGPSDISVRRHLKKFGSRYDLVILSRPHVVARHIGITRKFCPQAKTIYYTHDLHFLRLLREAEITGNAEKVREADEIKQIEFSAVNQTDATIFVSEKDKEFVQNELPQEKLHVLPLIQSVPGTNKRFAERRDLVFIGNFLHTPNGDAMKFFVKEVMPLVREKLPSVRLHIIGGNASDEVKALSAEDVIFTGFVKDLNSLLDRIRISVVPLRYGAGIKGKIISAMAAGLPVVATNIAAEGMSLVDRKTALLADEPEKIAEALIKLYQDEVLWNEISREGIEFARNTWGAESAWKTLAKIIADLNIEIRQHPYPLSAYYDAENLSVNNRT